MGPLAQRRGTGVVVQSHLAQTRLDKEAGKTENKFLFINKIGKLL
jgi:hypothetical protein